MGNVDKITIPEPGRFRSEALKLLDSFSPREAQTPLERVRNLALGFSRLPFENLSKLIKTNTTPGKPRMRFPDEVLSDHLAFHLGGTCFALTYYLLAILESEGFEASPLLCHMGWGDNVHTGVRLSHAGEDYLIDPGYLIFQPLPLRGKTIRRRRGNLEGIELAYDELRDTYTVFTLRAGERNRRYWFQSRTVGLEEYGEKWDASFSSPLLSGICLTRVTADEMIYIHNDYLKITRPDEILKNRDANLSLEAIRQHFGIPLELVEEARILLQNHKPLKGV